MAAKLEAGLNERVGNRTLNFVETPAQNGGRSHSNSTCFSYGEYDRSEKFGEVCHNLLSCIKSALDDAEPMNIVHTLKEARELALKMISG